MVISTSEIAIIFFNLWHAWAYPGIRMLENSIVDTLKTKKMHMNIVASTRD